MTFNKKLLAAALVTAGGFAAISSANAATDSPGAFDVNMIVDAACNVTVGEGQDINFTRVTAATTIAPASAPSKSSDAGIEVKCSTNAPYTVYLQSATNASTTGEGTMTGPVGPNAEPAQTLTYQLFNATDTAWGKTAGVSGTGAGLTANAQVHVVTAKLTQTSTEVRPGAYKDTVNVSITY